MSEFKSTAEAVASFEAQGILEPGEEGFWKIWGANVHSIRKGDLILTETDARNQEWCLILDTFEAQAAPLRRGLIDDSGKFTLGVGFPVIVLRWGTHNTLVEA